VDLSILSACDGYVIHVMLIVVCIYIYDACDFLVEWGIVKAKNKKNIGHFVVRLMAGARQRDHI
jgi:hypothetical protein